MSGNSFRSFASAPQWSTRGHANLCAPAEEARQQRLPGILIYGAGGHGRVVADVVARQGQCEVLGFLDDNRRLWGAELSGYRVLGDASVLNREAFSGISVIIAVGDNQTRKLLAMRLGALGCSFISAIHPSAQIALDTEIASGSMLMANGTVNPGARIGSHVIVNTGAIVEHDCLVEDYVHISPRAVLGGGVFVGECAHIGMGSSVLPNVRIGARSVVGAGAVVTRDVGPDMTVVGIPARPLKRSKK